jgi:hypothetical protein
MGSAGGGTGGGAGGGGTGGMGSKTCNDLLAGDPASASWSTTDPTADFTTAGGTAYDALNKCACEDTVASGGCKDVCTTGLNGTNTPNFCDSGKTPNQNTSATSCYGCLMMTCGTEVADCKSN